MTLRMESIPPGGIELGYAEITQDFVTAQAGAPGDLISIGGKSLRVDVPAAPQSRTVWVEFVGGCSVSVGGAVPIFVLQESTNGGTTWTDIQVGSDRPSNSGVTIPEVWKRRRTIPANQARSYRVVTRIAGGGNVVIYATAPSVSFLVVNQIVPSA